MMEAESSPLVVEDDEVSGDYEIYGDELQASVKSTASTISRVTLSGGLDNGEGGTTNLATLIHLLKGNIGTGILSLPAAIKSGGMIVGPIILLIVALMAIHCMQLLVRCSHYFCKKKNIAALSYGEVAYECTKPVLRERSPLAKSVVNAFLVVTQLGFCSIYLVLGSSTIVEVAGWDDGYKRIVIFMLTLPAILFSFIRSLERLAYISFFANLLCIFGLISIFQYCATNLNDPSIYPFYGKLSEIPMCMALAIFSYEGIGCILPLENQMKNPEDFSWVVNVGMGLSTTLYLSMGILGYIAFGNTIEGSITLNLPDILFYDAVKIAYATAMFFTYFIQFYVPMQILLPPLLNRYQRSGGSCFEYSFRTFVVILTGAMGAAIPQIENFIALVGAVASSGLALIFPPLFHILTFRNNGLTRLELFKDIFIITMGFLAFIIGGYSAMANIIKGFNTHHTDIHNSTIHNDTYIMQFNNMY